MAGDPLPSKPTPSTLRAPRLFDSQATTLFFLSPPSAPLSAQSRQVSEAWEPGARPAGRQQQPALLQPSLPKALTVHVSPLPGAGCPQAAVCSPPSISPPRSRGRTAAGLLDFAGVRQGDFWGAARCASRRRLRAGGGSQRPLVFKRATGCKPDFCNRPQKGFEGKTPFGSPSGQVGAALRGVLRSWQVCASQTRQHHLHSWSLPTILCPGRGCHLGSIVEIGLGKEKARACRGL